MDRQAVRLIQEKLAADGHYHDVVDGIRGANTHTAAKAALLSAPGGLPAGWQNWSGKRHAIAFLQLYCMENGINAGDVDGWWGPQTEFAARALHQKINLGAPRLWRDETPSAANPHGFPKQSGVPAFYGPHGIPDAPTPPPPLVKVPCPWKMLIAWNQNQSRGHFNVHPKCADSLGDVVEKVHAHYGEAEIARLGLNLFGGDYNARSIRGGSSWSMHSWGIAIDFDPAHNKLRWGRDRARFAHPDYIDWWEIWEASGWVSLGRARNFDWMHVQAARLN